MEEVPRYEANENFGLTDDQRFNVLIVQMQERNQAWHKMRERSMQFTLWILGLAVAASWHLLQNPCDGLGQKCAMTGLAVALAVVSFYFLQALNRGVGKNKEGLINIERELGLHDDKRPVLPEEYQKVKHGWSSHFRTLYALLVVTLLYLLAAIWVSAWNPNKTSIDNETHKKQTNEVMK